MSESKKLDDVSTEEPINVLDSNIAAPDLEVATVASSVKSIQNTTSSERQLKFERAQRCLENAALVSKKIKEHRKATAELLGRPFEDDLPDAEMASTVSERTGYSAATDHSTTLSVEAALSIPGISESLANTLKQKEILMERIKQYKEISKRQVKPISASITKESSSASHTTKSLDNTEFTKLTNTIKEKENALSIMQIKIKAMETTILDLQEKINEKDQIIEAKNRATTLISDSLSKKEKDTLELLEDTKQQMTKMQNNFLNMELEWKKEKQDLVSQLEEKNEKIKNLEEANTILENSRFEISIAHSKLSEELELNKQTIKELEEKIHHLTVSNESQDNSNIEVEQEKGSLEITNMEELTKKMEWLEQINYQIRQTNKELESQLSTNSPEVKPSVKKGSPLPTRKGGRSSKLKSPWSQVSTESLNQDTEKKTKSDKSKSEILLQSLNKDILDKEYIISQKNETISKLESLNNTKDETISELKSQIDSQKQVNETIEVSTNTDVEGETQHKPVVADESGATVKYLQEKLLNAQSQIEALTNEIDIANKNMIKVKSTSKLKLKQLQKSIENFSKVSDSHAEIVKLNEQIHQLSQRVAELEEEKGNLQLHLVDYDSGRLTETEIYRKMVEMENLAEVRLKSITLLETQKFELVQELHNMQQKCVEMEDKLADMCQLQNEQVCTEMKSVELEEQIDELTSSKKELELVIENLRLDKEHLNNALKLLHDEKDELSHKLENYIQENMELTDKLEKLSAEKVSSAESIEIVESLTTQEKLELEEYNKSVESDSKGETHIHHMTISEEKEKLVEEAIELKKKLELFAQERQEVMDKMNKMCSENDDLHKKLTELKEESDKLRDNINILVNEKHKLKLVNEELTQNIEDLKQEKLEMVKETVEVVKRPSIDENIDTPIGETPIDDKSSNEKGINRSKSMKQLTKEILKLKNTIKERENEIADCQMKILSLEEQQEKQKELLQNLDSKEATLRRLTDENTQLKKDIEELKINKESDANILQLKHDHDKLQQDLQKIHQEYNSAINTRDSRIHELEQLLLEYEKQVITYANSLQQKDKEISEYINQITMLNDLSQKLKSTIDLFESEKVKDQNLERGLNKQITMQQKTLAEYEEKLRNLEKEKTQLVSLKNKLENKNNNIEYEMKALQETIAERTTRINDLEMQSKEFSSLMAQAKERDEEIHQIKLELRKESIENEKLRKLIEQKDLEIDELKKRFTDVTNQLNAIFNVDVTKSEQYAALENKNKELMEKLKKYAVSLKKKTAMYSELEKRLNEAQEQLEMKNQQVEQLCIQVEIIPALKEKLKYAEEEINQLQTKQKILENNFEELHRGQAENKTLKESNIGLENQVMSLNTHLDTLSMNLEAAYDENSTLKSNIENLNKKIVEYEVDQKNSSNLLTKIACLEAEVNKKQMQLTELSNVHDNHSEKLSQMQFSHEAKLQEQDMYIESLQSEIEKYKSRIGRLEESISKMENSRLSLERKADQLDYQLQDKQKAYNDYVNQEDELVSRLAVLIDHDKVVEKQLQELENENKELKYKIQNFKEDLQKVNELHSVLQEKYHVYEVKANKYDVVEQELNDCQTKLSDMEIMMKRVTNENQMTLAQKNKDLENLELEFTTQIESTIKDKKILSEKYEKACEYVNKLELEIQESRSTIENLTSNCRDIVLENQKLLEESSVAKQLACPDYTEQYIGEINKLQSVVNSKNEEITEISNKIQSIHSNNLSKLSIVEGKVIELDEKLKFSSTEISRLQEEISSLKHNNDNLQITLAQKEDQIKQLIENKKLVFEMTIPKTEGMTISSTIEALDTEQKPCDVSSIESQIISEGDIVAQRSDNVQKREEKKVKLPLQTGPSGEIMEPAIIIKKSYICYKKDEEVEETSIDPFNSDEGWGLEANIESDEVTPGMAYLHKQINILNEANLTLKKDLDVSNNKLLKALKKLKELKSTNEMLMNELKLTKQLSQSSMLDMAIENELSSNVEVLEKKVQDLNTELTKEKREKEAIKKQNEILKNANDRMIEMKEKMDNEVELWKYNFKQANDKLSSMQWGGESKSYESKGSFDEPIPVQTTRSVYEEDLLKVEKENDELQILVDNLTTQNKTLSTQVMQSKVEIDNLKQQLEERLSKCEDLKNQLLELENKNTALQKSYTVCSENISLLETQYNELKHDRDQLKCSFEDCKLEYETKNSELVAKNNDLVDEIQSLKHLQSENALKLSSLYSELESAKLELQNYRDDKDKNMDSMIIAEKYNSLEEINLNLQKSFDEANKNNEKLKLENSTLLEKINEYENKIDDLTKQINQLNSENDQLLSSVAELRASISSALDQRGFEIAELWKQHLAQRENEFQTLEHDLRNQLNAFEVKYEQLLENVQSSSQEETNKIVMTEQLTSLQTKLQEKEEHLLDLQNKYADAISQLDMLRSEIEDERLMLENKLLVQQEEYENVIKDLNSSHQLHLSDYENKNKILSAEIDTLKSESTNLDKHLEEIKQQYEIEITELKKQLQRKEVEIFQKTHDFTISLNQRNEEFEVIRKQLVEYEKRIEELTFEKESELAMLRLKIHEHGETSAKIQKDLESERNTLSEALNEKIIECTNLNKSISDLNKELKEYADKAAETQMVLESQELEIVTLKDEISSLRDTLRSASSKVEKHVTFSSDTKKNLEEETQSILSKDLLNAVPKAELDLAMYMLHQRDVRCEELTLELTQLLEERDTLQLRLSDSLRSYEELRSQLAGANIDQSGHVSPTALSDLSAASAVTDRQFVDTHRGQTSRSSSVSDPDVEKPKLQAKLSELRSVKHSRDVVLRHESEQRQLGMRLLHRDVANLPPEAIEQLTQAHHTLSRDSQSTSTVLLNWLRGKSTPKVVHM